MTRTPDVPHPLGEFEQLVLLSILQAREDAYALAVLKQLDERANRRVDRGTLYKTLDRLEAKGLVEWTVEDATPDRGGHRRRLFAVTDRGIAQLRRSRQVLFNLWDGLDPVLRGSS
jgi:DNA-binding PadR family transcriptional regulator